MSTRIDPRTVLATALLFACTSNAGAQTAPTSPLDDPAAVKAAFAARIGHPVDVLEFLFGEHYARMLVQTGADFDEYEAIPGQALAEGKPKKTGDVDCKRKVAFDAVDATAGARVLAQARAIAAANGYSEPENVTLGAGMLCEAFGWRAILTGARNDDAMLQILWMPDGAAPKAQEFRDDRWRAVDVAKLLAGSAQAAPAPPKAEARTAAGDGRQRDFLRGIEADLARLEAEVGAPLGIMRIGVDPRKLSLDLLQPGNGKRVATWLVDADGAMRLWDEDDTMPLDCNKPFTTADFPLAQLPALIEDALTRIPPMPQARVKGVSVYRSGFCGKPHVYIKLEDRRGYGNVEYDQRGKLVSAEIQ